MSEKKAETISELSPQPIQLTLDEEFKRMLGTKPADKDEIKVSTQRFALFSTRLRIVACHRSGKNDTTGSFSVD